MRMEYHPNERREAPSKTDASQHLNALIQEENERNKIVFFVAFSGICSVSDCEIA